MTIAIKVSPPTPMMPARRAFLSGSLSGLDPHLAHIPAERIALLREIALRWEHRLPQGAIPHLQVSDVCAGHCICAAVCPTGALRRFDEPASQGLEFDAAACFACGACVVVCPEEALQLEAGGAVPAGFRQITGHALRLCARCEDEFAARGDDELCPACRKDLALFTNQRVCTEATL